MKSLLLFNNLAEPLDHSPVQVRRPVSACISGPVCGGGIGEITVSRSAGELTCPVGAGS